MEVNLQSKVENDLDRIFQQARNKTCTYVCQRRGCILDQDSTLCWAIRWHLISNDSAESLSRPRKYIENTLLKLGSIGIEQAGGQVSLNMESYTRSSQPMASTQSAQLLGTMYGLGGTSAATEYFQALRFHQTQRNSCQSL